MPCRSSRNSTRRPGSAFADWGHGDAVVPEEPWEARVMQDAAFWSEYGCPFDARAVLPAREYQAHMAILEGKAKKMKEESEKAKRGRRRW